MSVSREQILIITSLTLVFLIAGGFVLLYVNLYNQRKKRHIEEQQRLAERYAMELVQARAEVQEQTLQTIGAEIHDNIGQLLSLVKLTLSSVSTHQPEKTAQKIGEALDLLDNGIRELRQLSSLLYAKNLLQQGLENATLFSLNWLERSGRFTVRFERKGLRREPDPATAVVAYRIVQEILNNLIRHADATQIQVCFSYEDERLSMLLSDNGKGFNAEQALKDGKGLGLDNLFKRARLIGSTLELNTRPGQGTFWKLHLPYAQTQVHGTH